MLGSDVNVVGARLLARSASLGASGPRIPRVLAINGARVGIAILLSRGDGARHTTMSGSSNNRLGARVNATTTKLRTDRPSGPGRELAINGASKGVAREDSGKSSTSHTSVSSSVHNRTSFCLGTSGATLGARTVARPGRDLAINCACESVARNRGGESRANDATVCYIRGDTARLGLGTGAARLGASAVARPCRYNAVDGASESVARSGRRQTSANNATMGNVGHDGARLGLGTSATRFGASTVARPARYLAVDGATEGVAGVSGRKRRTDDASMGNVGHDGTSLGLGANPTGLGA